MYHLIVKESPQSNEYTLATCCGRTGGPTIHPNFVTRQASEAVHKWEVYFTEPTPTERKKASTHPEDVGAVDVRL